MSKMMTVTLEIEVADLSDDERKEHAGDMGIDPSELERLEDMSAPMCAQPLRNICPELVKELFAGSDSYVTYLGARVKSASFIGECPKCESPEPKMHPAVQVEGEIHTRYDPFHGTPTEPA